MIKGLIDLDLIVYQVGSIADRKHWIYKGDRYDSKVELNRILNQDEVTDIAVECFKDPMTEKECKKIVVSSVENILDKFEDYQGYISGKGNFRYKVATILPYKGNRINVDKPIHYDMIRQFLVDSYGAKVSVDREADDELGLAQDSDTTIASIDKDLDCVPGRHYNWSSDKHYEVSEIEANRNFFKQLLIGDSTDNILGLFNVGPKSTYVSKLRKMEDSSEMYDSVKIQYMNRFGSYWSMFMKENAQLLWIMQKRKCPALEYLKEEELL